MKYGTISGKKGTNQIGLLICPNVVSMAEMSNDLLADLKLLITLIAA
jgi:hypothetical protein